MIQVQLSQKLKEPHYCIKSDFSCFSGCQLVPVLSPKTLAGVKYFTGLSGREHGAPVFNSCSRKISASVLKRLFSLSCLHLSQSWDPCQSMLMIYFFFWTQICMIINLTTWHIDQTTEEWRFFMTPLIHESKGAEPTNVQPQRRANQANTLTIWGGGSGRR